MCTAPRHCIWARSHSPTFPHTRSLMLALTFALLTHTNTCLHMLTLNSCPSPHIHSLKHVGWTWHIHTINPSPLSQTRPEGFLPLPCLPTCPLPLTVSCDRVYRQGVTAYGRRKDQTLGICLEGTIMHPRLQQLKFWSIHTSCSLSSEQNQMTLGKDGRSLSSFPIAESIYLLSSKIILFKSLGR